MQDVVVNLAAETGTGQSMYEVSRYEQVNLAGTANLYELLTKEEARHVRRVIVASSRAVYGEGAYTCPHHGTVYPASRSKEDKIKGFFDPVCPLCGAQSDTVPTPESAPFQPASFYGLTKQVQEQMTLLFGQVLAIPSFALRYQNVYGPGQSLHNPYTGILAVFSNLAREGKPINIFEDGHESRDFVYVTDVVAATMACIESEITGTHSFNVGSGERVTVSQVAEGIRAFFGSQSELCITGAFREGDIRHGSADLSNIGSALGFQPTWRFEDGLKKFLEWTRESAPSSMAYDDSIREMKKRGLLHDA
jgi:dTDP-L-rhamnose 4-epimerase